MDKPVVLEIPQSEWEKISLELVRTVAVMQEQQRESEERWAHIAELKAETLDLQEELKRSLRNVDNARAGEELKAK
jgi:squalene cyclase